MTIVSGPPPIPYRARNKETGAQVANARVALGVSWKSILFFVALILGFFALLFVL
ncbi:MAG: hypothetical protein KKE24_06310 [Candidatus Thermoplasmatota archaeon]|nr:hypothetical protein [Candidatus Thermoplasmatota archaeon]